MAEQNCSCCNRTFPSSQLRRHAVSCAHCASSHQDRSSWLTTLQNSSSECMGAQKLGSCMQVGGGVRGVNELLCADCWGVFASAPWDLAGAASPAAEAPAVDTTAPPAVQSGAASGSGAEHADAASSALEHGLLDGRAHGRAQAMDAVTRLSGGGGLWQRPVGVSKVPSNESLDHARRMEPDDKLSGVRASGLPSEAAARPEAAEQKPAGPKLKRDRSGRFVSRKQQGAGEADGVGQRPEGPAQALQSTDVPALPEVLPLLSGSTG